MKASNIFFSIILTGIMMMPHTADAQIFKRIQKEAERKLMKKVEDRVVEEISTAIVRAAYKPIDKAFDNMVREYYGADTLENGEIDWDSVNAAYAGMMSDLDASDRLPDSYTFDLYMDVSMEDYDGQRTNSRMYYASGKELFALSQEEGNNDNLVVVDIENDLIAMFSEEDGQKKVQAVPNMLKVAAAFAPDEMNEEMGELKLEKTGKTKDIAGYYTEEYKGENKQENITCYVAPEFPVDWKETFGGFVAQYTPESYSETVNKLQGMIMYSKNTLKENNKKESTWEVTGVSEEPQVIDVTLYEKQSYGSSEK